MSRKKPAPDLIRGGYRFSEKDMRHLIQDALRSKTGPPQAARFVFNGLARASEREVVEIDLGVERVATGFAQPSVTDAAIIDK